jgi:hypothetical protein
MLTGDGDKWVAMFDAFLDEAGTNEGCPVVTVAGFYASQDQWAAFRQIWKPHSQGFHALHSDDRFPALCRAITESGVKGLFVTVGKATYRRLATDHMKSFMGNAYAVCAFMCAMSICREVNAPTSFVLEQGQPNLDFVKRILEAMIDAGDPCVAAVASARKEQFIELHPADFIAHCGSSHDKPWLQKLFDVDCLKHGHIGEKELMKLAPEITAIVKNAKNERLKAKRNR